MLFRSLWSNGVDRCFHRGRAVVLPRGFGYKLDTTCWNHVADAWTNCTRFIRAVDHRQGTPSERNVLVKVLQLVAGDQARWAAKVHPDVGTFCTLTCELGFLPWKLALGAEEWEIRGARELLGATERPMAWLGVSQLREEDVRIHTDMVCGVAIPPELLGACIEIGAFGAHPYGGADADVAVDAVDAVDAADAAVDASAEGDATAGRVGNDDGTYFCSLGQIHYDSDPCYCEDQDEWTGESAEGEW